MKAFGNPLPLLGSCGANSTDGTCGAAWAHLVAALSTILKMSGNETLIKVEHVSKTYARSLKKSLYYGLVDTAREFSPRRIFPSADGDVDERRPLRPSEFYANDDVTFEVNRGECFGLIGHNGAGKTTLLKMLNGLIKPDRGRIEMRGRIGAMIALSAGFNTILSGRENILINGSILGFSRREMLEKMDRIIEFSEIGDAIDSPVRTYSSGMQMRLGFSVAINLDLDVLLIDEVLAVGDMGFRTKCMNSIREVLPRTAVIFVSHSMSLISSICTHAVLMRKGRVAMSGSDVGSVVAGYLAEFGTADEVVNETGVARMEAIRVNGVEIGFGDEAITHWGAGLTIEFLIRTPVELGDTLVNVIVTNAEGVSVFASHSDHLTLAPGQTRVAFRLETIHLRQGVYTCSVGINEMQGGEVAKTHATYAGVGKFRVESSELYAVQANSIAYIPGEWTCHTV